MIPVAEPMIGEDERSHVDRVLRSSQLADGPEVRGFERDFADYCEVEFAVATSSGTTALHAALVGLGIGAGDRVLTSPFSFIASANAPRFLGAEVDFVDIDPETYTLDPAALETSLREGQPVDAVIAVHLYGLPADMDRLGELAETYDFSLIEDAAQAHGATYQGQPVGSIADVGCFSFYPTKNMTTGEGGMITTEHTAVADRAARYVDHGRDEGYRHSSLGHNFRMTSIAAAIGRAQLERLTEFLETRRANARRLDEALDDLPLRTPVEPADRRHAYNQYTIESSDRDRLREHLETAGISTGVYYPIPIHQQPAFGPRTDRYPVAEQASRRVLSLPVHPNLSSDNIEYISEQLASAVGVTP